MDIIIKMSNHHQLPLYMSGSKLAEQASHNLFSNENIWLLDCKVINSTLNNSFKYVHLRIIAAEGILCSELECKSL